MSWNNCRKALCGRRAPYTSALFKVLLTLKLLHGSRGGAKGSSLEDIAMHMIKHFNLDGDIKSQVLATLKYGVKMHYIQKRKEKFALILPASSIHLAPCKFKNEEMERIRCIYPPVWQSNACNDSACGNTAGQSCCGKRKSALPTLCCQEDEESFRSKRSKDDCVCSRTSVARQSSCSECFSPPKRSKAPCPIVKHPICVRKKGKCGRSRSSSLWDNYCQLCDYSDDENEQCFPGRNYDAYKNCSCCDK